MSKIKSIKVIKDYKFSLWDKTLEDLIKLNPEAFEVEYEKPQILKRPDGSVISGLEDGESVYFIRYVYSAEAGQNIYSTDYNYYYKIEHDLSLKLGHIFLPEDTDLAEKKAKQLTKQFQIQLEIDRLNAEEDNEEKQYYYLRLNKFQTGVEIEKTFENALNVRVFSKKTAETILAKYSQDELKQYLGIII